MGSWNTLLLASHSDVRVKFSPPFSSQMVREAGELRDRLREAEERLEMMKSSNRELNAKIVSKHPWFSLDMYIALPM